jgi:hypothetical protein
MGPLRFKAVKIVTDNLRPCVFDRVSFMSSGTLSACLLLGLKNVVAAALIIVDLVIVKKCCCRHRTGVYVGWCFGFIVGCLRKLYVLCLLCVYFLSTGKLLNETRD